MIGRTISHYRVTDKIGEGGMGQVYRAEDETLRRRVALKFLPGDLASDPQARRRLLTEARLASRLNHPNIATIYEVVEEAESPFIAMELVEGETLRDVLSRGAISPEQVLGIARQIAGALAEAHEAGVLHRDMKPGNVMLDTSRRVRILDFGLAVGAALERRDGEDERSFIHRSVTNETSGGTVPYMPPEQLKGLPTDARGDIFSLGILLFECLTGELPFPGDTAVDVLFAILRRPPVEIHKLVPDLPAGWQRLIGRCLQKEPSERFQDMRELLRDLDSLDRVEEPKKPVAKSLAVLYFENLSAEREDEYFRDGMTEDVITELSQIRELRVFPRSAMLPFRDQDVTAQHAGQQLGALFVLEGSLRRSGNRLRITARLVETRTGHSVWAERFDRQLEDVFAIQDEIAESIANALRVVLSDEEKEAIGKQPTDDVQAYDFYLRGRKFFHQFRRQGYDFARQMFARAIAIDPGYARAYAGVADCCSLLYAYWDASEENLKEADKASRKALELDPDLAEAHVARGLALTHCKDIGGAEREFEAATRLDPALFEARYYHGRACYAQGRIEEAIRLYEEARRLRPDDHQVPGHLASIYHGLGRTEEAEKAGSDALEAAQKHLDVHPDDARALYLGACVHSLLGNREKALEWAGRALVMEPAEPTVLYNVACVYALQGRPEDALDCLEKAVKNGYAAKEWIQNDSDLESLRGSPRYKELLTGM